MTRLNLHAVQYSVHEKNTIGYLVAFESRRAGGGAILWRACNTVEADFKLLSYCFHGMFAALLSKPIRRTRDVGIEEELNNHLRATIY